MNKLYVIVIVFMLSDYYLSAYKALAQDKPKHKVSMKDSLDHAVDLSDYMIYSNGVVVVPIPITEPALGGIGGALAPIYLKRRATVVDTVNGIRRVRHVNPDMTAGMAMYTANNSWMVGGFRAGTFVKPGITYRAFLAYADLNLTFYRTFTNLGEKQFEFNIKTLPVYLQAQKQFRNHKWSAGLQYLFLDTRVAPPGDSLPSFLSGKELKSIVSQLGGIIQYDGRDNIFTPDKGFRIENSFYWSNSAIGSDYSFWRINFSAIGYTPISPKFLGGLRIEGQQVLGKPPFYLLPYINLRGIPAARYQGNTTLVSEAETRWDLYKRWSAVFFAGTGVAFDNWSNVFQNSVVYNYGTGFRYLLARKFKLRMGLDVARGPEQWGYYIVFGSNWFR
ncbi:MAG TPA: BamA/TamA family outer membrane protein [Mucilaginibacter sp.]|jgi:hypothetical protein